MINAHSGPSSEPTTVVDHSISTSPEDAIGIVETLTADSKVQESLTQEDSFIQTTSSSFSQYPDLAILSLPPMNLTLHLLSLSKQSQQRFFIEFSHMSQEIFAELCQKIYFPTQSFTIFTWVNVNCGLFYLFRDLNPPVGLAGKERSEAIATCARNVDAAVRCLRLSVASTFEAAQALLLAAFVVMEGERGSLSWTLVSTAARMAMDIGLHRLPNGKKHFHDRMLFWHIYALERSLAFNFGRSATISDCDVKTELPSSEEDFLSDWGLTFLEFINFAKLQYKIHVEILSASAQREDRVIRVRKVHEMADRLRQREADVTRRRGDTGHSSATVGIASMLTALYKTLPSDDAMTDHPLRFHPLCVEAGRIALKSLLDVWQFVLQQKAHKPDKSSIKLPLLFIPYMPYVAIFGNQIATGDQGDLQLMRDIVNILQTVSETTVATRKMYNGFLRLLRIAEVWPRAPSVNGGASIFGDVDMTEINWQDLGLSDQTWNQTLDDLDFGLGSEAIRDMMPWFDQQFSNSNSGP